MVKMQGASRRGWKSSWIFSSSWISSLGISRLFWSWRSSSRNASLRLDERTLPQLRTFGGRLRCGSWLLTIDSLIRLGPFQILGKHRLVALLLGRKKNITGCAARRPGRICFFVSQPVNAYDFHFLEPSTASAGSSDKIIIQRAYRSLSTPQPCKCSILSAISLCITTPWSKLT